MISASHVSRFASAKRLVGADAGKVDQHVERAERFHRLGHRVRRRLFAADIGDDRQDLRRRDAGANAGYRGLHRRGIVVDQHHAAALLAKQSAGGGADAAGASGDDGDLASRRRVRSQSHCAAHAAAAWAAG